MSNLGHTIRREFPLFNDPANQGLVYLDNAATTQRPLQVVEALRDFYYHDNANPHRGAYRLAERATQRYEEARDKVAGFIGAASSEEIIFTRNATEAVNLAVYAWADHVLQEGDDIIVTEMEHHSNLVPWQMLAQRHHASLRYVEFDGQGQLQLDQFDAFLRLRPRVVAVTQVSNALGTINPVAEIIRRAHAAGAVVVLDGAQSVPHMAVNVTGLDVDFLVFSGHKMLGPLGIGVLYAHKRLHDAMQPVLYGGDMISNVDYDHSDWNDMPWKFEAGTQNVAGAVGLAAAIDFLRDLGMDAVAEHDHMLTTYALEQLQQLDGITLYGPRQNHGAAISFNLTGIHPHDLATFLDQASIAIRSGHHCAQIVMKKLGLAATARASFYLYNTLEEVDRLIAGLNQAKDYFKKWL